MTFRGAVTQKMMGSTSSAPASSPERMGSRCLWGCDDAISKTIKAQRLNYLTAITLFWIPGSITFYFMKPMRT